MTIVIYLGSVESLPSTNKGADAVAIVKGIKRKQTVFSQTKQLPLCPAHRSTWPGTNIQQQRARQGSLPLLYPRS